MIYGKFRKKKWFFLISRTLKEQRPLRSRAEHQMFAPDKNTEQEPNEHAVVL